MVPRLYLHQYDQQDIQSFCMKITVISFSQSMSTTKKDRKAKFGLRIDVQSFLVGLLTFIVRFLIG